MSKPTVLSIVLLSLLAACTSGNNHEQEQAQEGLSRLTFDGLAPGALPRDFHVAETNGRGTPASWGIEVRKDAPSGDRVVSVLETRNSGSTYNLLLSERIFPADLRLAVKILAREGREDQGGGLVWRARDANNYQIARWNPLENNLRVYKVVDGHRTMLESTTLDVDPTRWHALEIRVVGPEIRISFDGKKVLEAMDSTFKEGGRIGLWTKADAATSFDDLEVEWSSR